MSGDGTARETAYNAAVQCAPLPPPPPSASLSQLCRCSTHHASPAFAHRTFNTKLIKMLEAMENPE